jgi:hypothetical protein
VLNLASRMLLALLPPTQQFFRFSLDEAVLAQQGVDPTQRSSFEEALSKIERLVLREIEASNDRVVFHEALLHLVVSGNALLYVGSDGLRVYAPGIRWGTRWKWSPARRCQSMSCPRRCRTCWPKKTTS